MSRGKYLDQNWRAATTKRGYGESGIDERGENIFRLRWRANGKRHTKTFHGMKAEAGTELRALTTKVDTGEQVDPNKITVGQWIDQWIAAGAPGRKKQKVGQRTLERYEELLRVHVKPKLGAKLLQKLKATEIDKLYGELEQKLAPMTVIHAHRAFNSCLSTAERKGMLPPAGRCSRLRGVRIPPPPGYSCHPALGQGRTRAHGGRADRRRPGGHAGKLCEAQTQTNGRHLSDDRHQCNLCRNSWVLSCLGPTWVPFGLCSRQAAA